MTASLFTALDSQRTGLDLPNGCCPGWDALGQQGGAGVERGRADVLIVRDGMIIARMDIVKEGVNASERPAEAFAGCLFYERKDVQDPGERRPYELAKGCVTFRVVK